MSEWKEFKLKDFAQINPKETLKKGVVARKIAMENLSPFKKKIEGWKEASFNGGSKFINGDTLLARITPCLENGKTAFVDVLENDEVAFGSTEFIVLRENPEVSDRKFLYYFAISPEFRDEAILAMTGSSGCQRVEIEAIANRLFEFPPLPEQKAIAEVLTSLDDKIDLLHKQNKTLEQLAETLFRHHFIDNAQDDWEERPLDAVVDISIGRTPPRQESQWFSRNSSDIKWISIKDMGGDGVYISSTSECLTKAAVEKFKIPTIPENTVLLSFKMTVGRVVITTEEMLSNEAIAQFKFNHITPFTEEYLYLFLRSFKWDLLGSTSSIVTSINSAMIKEMEIVIPDEDSMLKFEEITKPQFQKIRENQEQIQTLEKLRDQLLPKLMSGGILINKSEDFGND